MATQRQHKEAQADGVSSASVVFDSAVLAGSLITIFAKYEGPSRTLSMSDGTSTLSSTTQKDNPFTSPTNDMHTQEFYLLNANSGATTFTLTITGGTAAFISLMAEEWTGSTTGTWALDGTPIANASSGTTSLTSGNITTTGTEGVARAGYGEYSTSAISSPAINGVSASTNLIQLSGTTYSATWHTTYAAGFTGQATATLASTDQFNLSLIAFKFTASSTIFLPNRNIIQNILIRR